MTDFSKIKNLFNITKKEGFNEESVKGAEIRFNGLPKVLIDYYIELGKVFNLNNSQDRLLPPDKINDLGEYIEFYVENQYVCRWCIAKKDLKMENPPVYITEDGESFDEESNSLSDFLCTMAYLQGIWGLDYGCEEILDIEKDDVDLIRNKYKKKDIPSLKKWMNVEFYGNHDDEVIALINNDYYYNLCYAANDEEHFENMDEFFDNDIDEC